MSINNLHALCLSEICVKKNLSFSILLLWKNNGKITVKQMNFSRKKTHNT